jgi:hypothetical protein
LYLKGIYFFHLQLPKAAATIVALFAMNTKQLKLVRHDRLKQMCKENNVTYSKGTSKEDICVTLGHNSSSMKQKSSEKIPETSSSLPT